MNAGINLFTLRKFIQSENDFLASAERLKEMGYSYLQYSGAPFDAGMIKRVCTASEMPVVLTHVPMDRILNDTERLMEEHSEFGCRNIGLGMMPIDTISDEKLCKETIERLERSAQTMRKNGFRLFYHHHHFEFTRFADGQTVFDYILSTTSDIHITADTYWLQYGGVSVYDTLKRLAGRAECVHFKDYRIVRDPENKNRYLPQFAPVGDGNMDFAALAELCRTPGTEYVFVEQDDACNYPDPFEQAERSIRYLKKL